MLSFICQQTEVYRRKHNKNERKEKAQFFTPYSVAKYMAAECSHPSTHLRILDPGSGNGALAAAIIEHCVKNHLCLDFTVHFVENDPDVIPLLQGTVAKLKEFAIKNNCRINCVVFQKNFISEFAEAGYDIIICNPPYKKLRKDSLESQIMRQYVFGQPNLYALFMAKSVNLLNDNGQFIFITPRSWTSGNYYKNVRKHLFDNLSIHSILLFADRNKSFGDEDVLQETMILSATKNRVQKDQIRIRSSEDSGLSFTNEFDITAKDIKNIGSDNYLLIPASQTEADILHKMSSIDSTFNSLGYLFKTGPVVEFRNKEAISASPGKDKVPMYRSAHITEGTFIFPAKTDKPQYVDRYHPNLLLKNENTVLLRRLSAKEENRRLQSCVYKKRGDNEYISIENHVNYLVRKDGKPLTEKETEWINSVLMSDDYDIYFRMINGSTQVNAGEINNLPLKPQGR